MNQRQSFQSQVFQQRALQKQVQQKAQNQPITQTGRIRQLIRDQIHSGLLVKRQKLPSERELSELFSTTRITVKEALVSLENEGVIYREERRGWYVSPDRIRYNPLSRCHFHQMITDQNRKARTQLVGVTSEIATGDCATALELSSMSSVYVIQRLRFIDERPVLFVENVLKQSLFNGILREDLSQSLTSIYKNKFGYQTQRSKFDVIPTAAPQNVAKALNLVEGQPVLKICRVNYNQHGVLMDCEFEYWRPDSVMLSIDSIG